MDAALVHLVCLYVSPSVRRSSGKACFPLECERNMAVSRRLEDVAWQPASTGRSLVSALRSPAAQEAAADPGRLLIHEKRLLRARKTRHDPCRLSRQRHQGVRPGPQERWNSQGPITK